MNSKLFALLSFVVTYLLLLVFHHEVMLAPNSFLLGDMVDGLKNYYTPLYHVYFDSSLSRFEGMNHPYGEQIVFADAQPLLSNLIKLVSNVWDIKPYTVGIMNFMMFISIPIGAIFLYLSLIKVEVKPSIALLGSIFISLLTPQLYRFGGHFALSYSFVIPLYLYLYFVSRATWQIKHSMWIGAFIWLISGLHMYYFALGAFMFLAIRLVELIGNQFMSWKKSAIKISLEVFMPFVLLQTWFIFTDNVVDRPNNPYGFLEYCSHWQSVFLPIGKNYIYLFQGVVNIKPHSWEGIAYVGFPVALFSLGVAITLLIKRFRSSLFSEFNALGIASVLLLLFSFGAPFIWNLEWLVEYSGPLKQFRGIGRFAWVFFYVVSFLFFVWFDRFLRLQSPIIKAVSISLVSFVYGAETFAHHTRTVYQTNDSKILLEQLESQKKAVEYNAIIPIPFFHTGSENIWVNEEGSEILKYSFSESLKSGKPIMGAQMSRTSLSQTIETLKLVYNGGESPSTIDPSKTYLLVKEKGYKAFGLLNMILQKGKPVEVFDGYATYSISGNDILKSAQLLEDIISGELIYSENFNHLQNTKGFNGSGALVGNMKNYSKFLELKTDTADLDLSVEFLYFLNKDVNPTVSIIEEHVDENGNVVVYNSKPIFVYIKTIGNWALISYPVSLKKGNKLLLHLQKYTAKKREILIDELKVYK